MLALRLGLICIELCLERSRGNKISMTASSTGNVTVANSLLFARVLRSSERVLLPINESAVRADTQLPAFYCVHSVSGAAGTDFLNLGQRLERTVSFYGLQAPPKLMQDDQFGASIESLADHYIKALVTFQPEGPLMIGGYCVGAIIALDMAKKLRAMGREVGPVIAIDGAPENVAVLSAWNPRYWLDMARNVPRWLSHSDLMKNRSLHSLMWSLSKHAIAIGKGMLGMTRTQKLGGGYAIDRVMDLSLYPPAQRSFINRLYAAIFTYFPEEYPGEVILYEANVAPLLYQPQLGRIWRKIASRSEIVGITGTHIGLMHEPYVSAIADDMCARVTKFFAGAAK
jgi:thioesterase domain-containing protein